MDDLDLHEADARADFGNFIIESLSDYDNLDTSDEEALWKNFDVYRTTHGGIHRVDRRFVTARL